MSFLNSGRNMTQETRNSGPTCQEETLNLGGERLAGNLVPRTLIRNVKALHSYSEVRFPILNKIDLLYWSHPSTHYSGVTLPENWGN